MRDKKFKFLPYLITIILIITSTPINSGAVDLNKNTLGDNLVSVSTESTNLSTDKSLASSIKVTDNLIKTYEPSSFAGQNCITFYSASEFSLTKTSYFSTDGTIEYRLGNPSINNWSAWTNATIAATRADDSLYYISLRGTNATYVTTSYKIKDYDNDSVASPPLTLTATKLVDCTGYIENLLDYQTMASGNIPTMAESQVFASLFKDFEMLSSAPSFAATNISGIVSCYREMFKGCISLKESPVLPALEIANFAYEFMFKDCFSLTKMNEICATKSGLMACERMFNNCSALEHAQDLNFTTLGQRGCQSMFSGCESLKKSPALPATTISQEAYERMFYRCKSLTEVGEIAGTTVIQQGCNGMFGECISLVNPPNLKLTSIGSNSCVEMFAGCTSLKSTPNLRIPTIPFYGCMQMFENCTSLETIGEIAATSIGAMGARRMFKGCTSLTAPPDINITSVSSDSCSEMFAGCTNLLYPIKLDVTQLNKNCFSEMYSGCTKLRIYTSPTTNEFGSFTTSWSIPEITEAQDWNTDMFKDCAVSIVPVLGTTYYILDSLKTISATADDITVQYDGNMHKGSVNVTAPLDNYTIYYSETDGNYNSTTMLQYRDVGVHTVYYLIVAKGYKDFKGSYTITITKENSNRLTFSSAASFSISKTSYFKTDGTLEYLLGDPKGNSWNVWNNETLTSAKYTDEKFYISLRGRNATYVTTTDTNLEEINPPLQMTGTKPIDSTGYVESLLDYEKLDLGEIPTMAQKGAFAGLFKECNMLASAPSFAATSIDNNTYCYCRMFEYCSSLTTAPKLPALYAPDYAYQNMFFCCFNLSSAGDISAKTLGVKACESMFAACQNLKATPKFDFETINTRSCQSMFTGCTSLTSTPSLKFNTIPRESCENMFSNCRSLVNAGDILATSVAQQGCTYMFEGCTSLVNPPNLYFEEMGGMCCQDMFRNCTSLTSSPEIKALVIGSGACERMFSGCEALSLAGKIHATTISGYGCAQMFDNCKSLMIPPQLCVQSVSISSCEEMFKECTSLKYPADLPQVELGEDCFKGMYDGCSSLQIYTEETVNTSGIYKRKWQIKSLSVEANWNKDMFARCQAFVTPQINTDYYILSTKEEIIATSQDVVATYDGFEHTGNVVVTSPVDSSDYTIYYSYGEADYSTDKPTFKRVGEYTVSYKVVAEGLDDYIDSFNVKIIPANLTVNPAGCDVTYDGIPHTGSVAVDAPPSEFTIEFAKEKTGEYSDTIPTFIDAGNYEVHYKIISHNYNDCEGSFNVIISKANITASANDVDVTYDGGEYCGNVIVENLSEYTVYYSEDGISYTDTQKKYIDAQEKTIHYKVVSKNYNDFLSSFNLNIRPAQMSVTSTSYTGSYDAKQHTGVVNVERPTTGYQIFYSTSEEGEYKTTPITYDQAGEHTVYYKVVANNYITFKSSFSVNITKIDMDIYAPNQSFTYNGEAQVPFIKVNLPTNNFIIKYKALPTYPYSDSMPKFINEGDYTLYYIVTAPNYNDYESSLTVTINSLKSIEASAKNIEVDYDGKYYKGEVIVTKPTDIETKITYSTDGITYTNTNPEYKDAGIHTVYYNISANGYNDFSSSFTITIKHLTIDVSIKDFEFSYDGNPHTGNIIVNKPQDNYTVYYSENEGFFESEEKISKIEPGEYTIHFKVVAKNYNDFVGSFLIKIIDKEVLTSEKIYIMYNPNSGEHLFTSKLGEYDKLEKVGWIKEGVSFYAYTKNVVGSSAIYRVYNPNAPGGDHHYTKSLSEVNKLVKLGWKRDNQGKPVFFAKGDVIVYKLYNKGNGRHHYTRKKGENDKLVRLGWVGEGIAWYATNEGDSANPIE